MPDETGRAEFHSEPSRHVVFDSATWARLKTRVVDVSVPSPFAPQLGMVLGIPVYIDECPCDLAHEQSMSEEEARACVDVLLSESRMYQLPAVADVVEDYADGRISAVDTLAALMKVVDDG